jgi:hypothetical protein
MREITATDYIEKESCGTLLAILYLIILQYWKTNHKSEDVI